MSNESIIALEFMTLIVLCVSLLGYSIYKTVKTEKRGKIFRNSLKTGDKCHLSTSDMGLTGEVIDTNPSEGSEFIKVSVLMRKSRIYPIK